ncbi:MAG: hypothetical protein BHV61_06595 [Collinsella sp. 60_9]|nr:MAG: hypothetical protein BHV61_06595 [Collinsella sp. 60_9]
MRRAEYGDWDHIVYMDAENARGLRRIFGDDPDGKISVGGKKYRMERFWKEDRVFLEKHYLFPIPTEELQRANIPQNPNW